MTDPLLPPPKKSRGAPAGNTNALKHGFYSRKLRKSDLSGIESTEMDGLADEITILRVFIRRVVELGKDVDNLPDALGLLRVLCFAVTSLTRLLRVQHLLAGDPKKEWLQAMDQALAEVTKELGIK